jgi:CHAD domain-containing protein
MAKARDIPGLSADMPFAAAAATTVRVRADELWEHSANVLDTNDIERVHDMRVATRRLRAVLEVYAPCFPKKPHRAVLRDVKRLADALGARRDPDIQLEDLTAFAAAVPKVNHAGVDLFARQLRADQEHGNAVLGAALEEARESDLRGRLDALAALAEPADRSTA